MFIFTNINVESLIHVPGSARKCVFISYAEFKKGYRCYDPITDTIHVSLDVSFSESEPYYSGGVTLCSLQGERGCEGNPSSLLHITEFEDIENLEARLSIPVYRMNDEPWLVKGSSRLVDINKKSTESSSQPIEIETDATDPILSIDIAHAEDIYEETAEAEDPPFSTPSTKESAQNVLREVSLNPTLTQASESENVEPRKSQRVTKGIRKKQYEL